MKDHKIIYTTKNSHPSITSTPHSTTFSSDLYNNSISNSTDISHLPIRSPLVSSQTSSPLNSIEPDTPNKSIEIELNSSRNTSQDLDASPGSSNQRYCDGIITKKEYFLFCFGFAVSVVPVVGVFTFAPVIFSKAGGIGNGIFCIGYTICSLLYTRNIIRSIGCKSSILWGHFGSGIYVAYYLICTTIAFRYSNILYPIGAFIGGVSQSIM